MECVGDGWAVQSKNGLLNLRGLNRTDRQYGTVDKSEFHVRIGGDYLVDLPRRFSTIRAVIIEKFVKFEVGRRRSFPDDARQ